jgi:CRP-like cAMP-binding protein
MLSPHKPQQNHLLAAMSDEDFARLAPHLELVQMKLGDVLYESGGKLTHMYFPTTAIVSLHYLLEGGGSSEMAGVGNEGVLGVSLFMGGETTPSRAVVLTAGYGYRIKAQTLVDEFNRTGTIMRLMLRYTQALMTQISQTAVCNRHHSVEQQLCRWLLLTLDRLPAPISTIRGAQMPASEFTMTQELIANMLGVRREGVTESAGRLQNFGYISYRRGHITVLDRIGLQGKVCECYAVVKKEFARLLSEIPQAQIDVTPTFAASTASTFAAPLASHTPQLQK